MGTYQPNLTMGMPGGNPAWMNQMPMTMSYPGLGNGAGGGGGSGNAFGTGGIDPISAGLNLFGGVLNAIGAAKKSKAAKKAYGAAQKAYQSKAESLFPELGKESFQYSNPQLTDAYKAGLGYLLSNMFGQWGSDKVGQQGSQTGLADIQKLFAALLAPQGQGNMGIPGNGPTGWNPLQFQNPGANPMQMQGQDPRAQQMRMAQMMAQQQSGRAPYRMMAGGGIVTQPTRAILGERGPEMVVPLGESYNRRGGSPHDQPTGEQYHQQMLSEQQKFHQKMLQQYQQNHQMGWRAQMYGPGR